MYFDQQGNEYATKEDYEKRDFKPYGIHKLLDSGESMYVAFIRAKSETHAIALYTSSSTDILSNVFAILET